jgi:hypothetical protein
VEGKRGMLPGTERAEYIRVPGILFLPVALIVSILYVVFLPFIGFAMLLTTIATKAAAAVRGVVGGVAEKLTVQAPAEKKR